MESLQKFAQFVREINLDSGRNYKFTILNKYKNDDDIKFYLNYVYSPYITTGLSSKKANKKLNLPERVEDPTVIKEYLIDLANNNTGTDDDITKFQLVRKYGLNNNLDLQELFTRICTKNLQLGVDTKTINKVIPGLIPDFSVQLAQKYFENPKYVEGKEFILTTKIDGCRIIAIKENGKVSFWTRQGQLYEGLVDLEKEMLISMPDCVLDGELTLLNKGNLDSGEQYKETTKLCRTKDLEKHGLKMLVFDIMMVDEFKTQYCPTIYNDRRKLLDSIFNAYKFTYFELLPVLYKGNDTSKITEILDRQVEAGEEGIMINIADATYKFGRCMDLLKCKKFQDTEVKVIGFEEGTNKLEGTLGALICEYKGSTVRVGSGFTDKDRDYIWGHKWEFENKYITVKYFEESHDSKTGLPSLRFPIYKGLRVDLC